MWLRYAASCVLSVNCFCSCCHDATTASHDTPTYVCQAFSSSVAGQPPSTDVQLYSCTTATAAYLCRACRESVINHRMVVALLLYLCIDLQRCSVLYCVQFWQEYICHLSHGYSTSRPPTSSSCYPAIDINTWYSSMHDRLQSARSGRRVLCLAFLLCCLGCLCKEYNTLSLQYNTITVQ